MTPSSPLRLALAVLLATVASVCAAVAPAVAAPGPPPPTLDPKVLAGIHTDAVSPFVDTVEGQQRLVLASRADVEGERAKRFAAHDVLFHLEDAAKATVPAGFEFLGPVGSPTWIAPMTQQPGVLWPGFSTEGVPSGVLDGDALDLRLESVRGPGTFHLFTIGSFGSPRQLMTVGGPGWRIATGQHVHANWAFSAAGRYELTFRADAKIGGATVTGTTTYAFHVSALPTAAATTTTLTRDPARVVLGEDVALGASVTPADAEGYVEFLDGETSLGHEPVADGRARLVTDALPLGDRAITARFTPRTSRPHAPSTSASKIVAVVAEPGGDAFEVAGVRSSYVAGETLNARVRGWTLRDGQSYRWTVRTGAGATEYVMTDAAGGTATQGTLARELTTAYDGAEIRASLRGPGPDGKVTTLQRTPYVALDVEGPDRGTGRSVTLTGAPTGPVYEGDTVQVAAQAQLGDGERLAWVVRAARIQADWSALPEDEVRGTGPYQLSTYRAGERELALQVVRADGTVAGRSAPLRFEALAREIQLEGLRSIYRVGDTLRATATLWPALPSATFTWGIDWEPIAGAAGTTVEVPVTKELDGKPLTLDVAANNGFTGWTGSAGYVTQRIAVTDAAPGEQVLLFDATAGHYHQGDTITLRLNADPTASDTDVVRWEWKRRGDAGFARMPGASGFTHTLVAEQALEGTEVRATLLTAGGEELATTEAPQTIHVDDHGAKPRQVVTVGGRPDGHTAGDRVELRAAVEPDTVLDRYRWLIQRPGQAEPEVVAGEHGAVYAFTATDALDGAKVSVAVAYADGTVAYGPAAPVTLAVAAAPPVEEEPPAGDEELPPAPSPQPPAVVAPVAPTQPAAPAAPPAAQRLDSRAVTAPRVARVAGRLSLRTRRSAVVARITCAAQCRVTAPKRVSVRIAGRRVAVRIEVSKTVRAVLSRSAARQLRGRRARLVVPVTVTADGRTTRTTVRVTLAG